MHSNFATISQCGVGCGRALLWNALPVACRALGAPVAGKDATGYAGAQALTSVVCFSLLMSLGLGNFDHTMLVFCGFKSWVLLGGVSVSEFFFWFVAIVLVNQLFEPHLWFFFF